MNRFFHLLITLSVVLLMSQIASAQAIKADHITTELAVIPDGALSPASALRVHLRRASVGGNISGGLDALQGDNAKYNRSHWVFGDRGNPGWQSKVEEFATFVVANASDYDVFSMKFCWIDPDAIFAAYRDTLLQLESRYPSKRFVWWTMPITRDPDGSESNRQDFNDSVRNFTVANGKLLFDIADIEAHNAAGVKKTDGSGHELQQDDWSSDGGHLNDAGARRVASAWWWLMARVAGWNGSTGVETQTQRIPQVLNISQNYPNPFNPATTIEFSLLKDSKVILKIYNVIGQEVATLLDGERKAGIVHRVVFDASRLTSGVYYYQLKASGSTQMKKLVLIK